MPEIKRLFPEYAIVSEEQTITHHWDDLDERPLFLVDPIDGTKELINKTGEFTLNIGLIKEGLPVAGIVYAPWLDRLFVADRDRLMRFMAVREAISVGQRTKHKIIAVASRSHFDP